MIFRGPCCWEDSPFLFAGVFCGWEPAWTLEDISVQILGSSRLVSLSWAFITYPAQKCLSWHTSPWAEQIAPGAPWPSVLHICLVAAHPLMVLRQLPETSSFPVSSEHPGHYASCWVSCGREDGEFCVTLLHIFFWTGGYEQLGRGPELPGKWRIQPPSDFSALWLQCIFFFQNTEKTKCPNEVHFLYSSF